MISLRKDYKTEQEYYQALGQYFYEHFLTKGLANKKHVTADKVDKQQFKMGVKVEFEHTDSEMIAARIALDHLAEIPDYYTRLAKMEKEAGIEESLSEADAEQVKEQNSESKWDPDMILLAYDNPKAALLVAKRFIQKHNLTEVMKIKDFDKHFVYAWMVFKKFSFISNRVDMPVVEPTDVKDLQWRLLNGVMDVNKPWSPETNPHDPFPTGLRGDAAKRFLTRGLRFHDLNDKIDVRLEQIALNKLKPVQRLIHVDKVLLEIQKFGIADAVDFIEHKGAFITSSDGYILDGHHRFFKGLLINPELNARCLLIQLPMQKLYKLLLAYGDAVGHVRKESLTEQRHDFGQGRTNPNAPTMAYFTVYGKWPDPPLRGREINHKVKTVKGIQIDRMIPTRAFYILLNSKNITTTASCQGQDERHVTFLIFKPKNQDEQYVKKLCKQLTQKGFKCYYDKGRQGEFRICVAEKLWYDEEHASKFFKWWFKLATTLYHLTK